MARHPDEILTDFAKAVKGTADINPHDILWEIINDVTDSAILAVRGADVSDKQLEEIDQTIEDYVANTYGDDSWLNWADADG